MYARFQSVGLSACLIGPFVCAACGRRALAFSSVGGGPFGRFSFFFGGRLGDGWSPGRRSAFGRPRPAPPGLQGALFRRPQARPTYMVVVVLGVSSLSRRSASIGTKIYRYIYIYIYTRVDLRIYMHSFTLFEQVESRCVGTRNLFVFLF